MITAMITTILASLQSMAAAIGTATLAYRPLLDPIPVDDYWLLLLFPLVFAIAIIYKAIKLDDLTHLLRQSIHLAGQIVVFMVLAAAGLWLMGMLV